jgi:RNA polymerase sigma factor (sigma-70 family)
MRAASCIALREDRIVSRLRLVRIIALRIHQNLPRSILLDDLFQYGCLGLIAAVDAYDPGRETTFEAYCRYKIRGAILDGIGRTQPPGAESETELADTRPRQDAQYQLSEILGQLPERQRTVLELRQRGATQLETARQLGISRQAVQRRQARAEYSLRSSSTGKRKYQLQRAA